VILSASEVVLTTHVNADGDGAGSEVAVARWLQEQGVRPTIVNPTPFPDAFRFLLEDLPAYTPAETEGAAALRRAGVLLVLDTSEASRLGRVADHLERPTVAVVDHHPPPSREIGDAVARAPTACATGELIFDMLGLHDGPLAEPVAQALYVAIVTDTGSFRFGNTTARAHEIAGRLIRAGVSVEAMFRHIFARYTSEGLALLERALGTLEVGSEGRVAWITLRSRDVEETGATAEDREGLVEYARRLQGVEVALLFRELPEGRTKVSARSNGDVDVSAVTRDLGGGGHRQAAGVLMDRPLEPAREAVLERVRRAVQEDLAG
jgi:phosphoesterase RecJ-like protein